jgi:photosystem II stability/assembly factor-like uncharacterized protein
MIIPGLPIVSVFFLNTRNGWILFSPTDSDQNEPTYSIDVTSDGGATWSTIPLDLKSLGLHHVVGPGQIVFSDTRRGWINLGIEGSSNFTPGVTLTTSDGGKTWQPKGPPCGFASVAPVTADEAWVVCAPNDYELYGTHDGGASWQEVSLPAPAGIYSSSDPSQKNTADSPAYDLPVFADADHGFVAVTYDGYSPVSSVAVLFSTIDGGKTWTPDSIITGLPEMSVGQKITSTVVASNWLVAKRSGNQFVLLSIPAHSKVAGSSVGLGSECTGGACYAGSVSMVTREEGWVRDRSGMVSATTDGGASWQQIARPANDGH